MKEREPIEIVDGVTYDDSILELERRLIKLAESDIKKSETIIAQQKLIEEVLEYQRRNVIIRDLEKRIQTNWNEIFCTAFLVIGLVEVFILVKLLN